MDLYFHSITFTNNSLHIHLDFQSTRTTKLMRISLDRQLWSSALELFYGDNTNIAPV